MISSTDNNATVIFHNPSSQSPVSMCELRVVLEGKEDGEEGQLIGVVDIPQTPFLHYYNNNGNTNPNYNNSDHNNDNHYSHCYSQLREKLLNDLDNRLPEDFSFVVQGVTLTSKQEETKYVFTNSNNNTTTTITTTTCNDTQRTKTKTTKTHRSTPCIIIRDEKKYQKHTQQVQQVQEEEQQQELKGQFITKQNHDCHNDNDKYLLPQLLYDDQSTLRHNNITTTPITLGDNSTIVYNPDIDKYIANSMLEMGENFRQREDEFINLMALFKSEVKPAMKTLVKKYHRAQAGIVQLQGQLADQGKQLIIKGEECQRLDERFKHCQEQLGGLTLREQEREKQDRQNQQDHENRQQRLKTKRQSKEQQDIYDSELKRLGVDVTHNLTELSLVSKNMGPLDIEAIAHSQRLSSLTNLNLSNNDIGVEGAKALANSTTLINLKELYLSSNDIGAEGVKALANSPNLAKIQELYLGNNNIGAQGGQYIANSTTLTHLRELYLGNNSIGDQGAKALANSTTLTNLEWLNLTHNSIGPDGTKTLAESRTLTALVELNLEGNNINDTSQEAILKSKRSSLDIEF